tara:strand:- start:2085 stop:2498 length:414 start_codon:yes stop_codon:yes gene_type:complete
MSFAHDFDTAFLRHKTVQEADIDFMGHVNNLIYLDWAAKMASDHWDAVASKDMREAGLWIVLRHEIDYHRELKLGDAVELRTWVAPVKGLRCPRHVDIRKAGAEKPSASVVTTWTYIDTATRRPKRLPPDVRDLFGM